jgi:hypothetical protein
MLLSFFCSWLCCLAFKLRLLITLLASSSFSCPFSFGYCVVWPSNDGFWLPLWRLQAFLVLFHLVIVLSGLHITPLISPFGIFKLFLSFFFWLLCCLAFQLRLLITPLASSNFSYPFSDNTITKRKRTRKAWRRQKGNQKPSFEGQTTQ